MQAPPIVRRANGSAWFIGKALSPPDSFDTILLKRWEAYILKLFPEEK